MRIARFVSFGLEALLKMPIFEFVRSSGKDETTKRELKKIKIHDTGTSVCVIFWNVLEQSMDFGTSVRRNCCSHRRNRPVPLPHVCQPWKQ
jgi:hypothetical protein